MSVALSFPYIYQIWSVLLSHVGDPLRTISILSFNAKYFEYSASVRALPAKCCLQLRLYETGILKLISVNFVQHGVL
jgi:hypothetical protein